MSRSTDTDPPLTVKAVFDVIVMAKYPSVLGFHLLEDEHEVTICMNDNPSNHCGLALAIAKLWIERSTEQPTWEKLIESLEKVHENTLAHKVRENCVLQRGSTTSTGFSGFCSSFSSSEPTSPGIRNMPTDAFAVASDLKLVEDAEDFNQMQIEQLFSSLTCDIADELESLNVRVSEVISHIGRLNDDHRFLLRLRKKKCKKMRDLFELVSTKKPKPLWSYENYDLLRRIIRMVAINKKDKDRLLEDVHEFVLKLNGHRVAQKLVKVLPKFLNESIDEPKPIEESCFCKDLMKKLKCRLKFTAQSLKYIDDLWSDIQCEYEIPSATAFLYHLAYGSLIITWLIQPSWACCILSKICTSVPFFREHSIEKVILDKSCIYDENNNGIASFKILLSLWLEQASLSGRVEKFQEVLSQPETDINAILSKENATPLMIAAYHGHAELVSFLLENEADSSATLTNGQTALHLAAIEGFSDVAGILHEDNNELLGVYDQRAYSPLMEAADRNHVDVVRVFFDQYSTEVDSTEIPTLNEAFLLAVEKGHTEITKLLHRCGANTSTVTEDERTALMIAAAARHTEIVEYLLGEEETEPEVRQSPEAVEEKTAALSLAIENGHLGIVEKLLQSKFRALIVDTLDSDGMTPLMRAVWRQLPELVSIIAEAGAELDLMNNDGKTALMLAAESGQRLIVEMLLTKGADINLQQETTGKTALHLASENGHLDVVEELVKLEYKADVAIGDKDGRTAHDVAKSEKIKVSVPKLTFRERIKKLFTFPNAKLISACKAGNLQQVKACIKAGANPNYVDKLDPFGWTGLMWASQNGHAEVVKFLLDNKADPNLKAKGSWTALILASRKAHYKVVEHLVNNGADVLIQNWQGWSALMWAANCPGKNNQTEEALGNRVKTAEILISKDRSIMDIPANDQWTPLIQASLDGNAGFVELLTKEGANRELHTKRHWTALMLATKHNKKEVVRALVKGGADVEHQKPADGMSALHVACVRGHTECLESMIKPQPGAEHKVNLELKDKWGMTPLMLASKHGNKKAAETLVGAGARVNVKSEKYAGWSALFFAIKGGYLEIAKLLLDNKANMSERDMNKQTPLGLAFSQRKDIYTKLIGFIQEKPQVLKAISSTAEASADTSHDKATAQPTVSPTQEETPDTQSPSRSDKHSGEATPTVTSSGQTAETESAPADVATLKQLMIEAETFAEPRASVNIKHLEGSYQRFRREAMQSERQAAGAA